MNEQSPSDPSGKPVQPGVPQAMPVQVVMPYYPPPPQKPRRRWGWLVGVTISLAFVVFFLAVMFGVYAAVSSASNYYQTRQLQEGKSKKVVAVVPLYGIVDSSMASFADRILPELAGDKNVAAVVLRIDSPGGTVAASDQINQAVQRFRKDSHKPVIISQGGYATSGGYYISAAGDYIFSEPTTWTGNIGVIMTIFQAEKGLKEKLGVTPVVITASETPYKGAGSPFADLTDEQRAHLNDLVKKAYNQFVKVVEDGRKGSVKTHEEVVKLADGKVYTADDAKKSGLVDEIGYLLEACTYAAQQAREPGATVVLYSPRMPGLAELLLSKSSVSEKLTEDPMEKIEGLMAPQALYLFSSQGMVRSWPTMNYAGNQ
jgi:protease-4